MRRFLSHKLYSGKCCGKMLVCTISGNNYIVEHYSEEIHSTEFINGTVIVGSRHLSEYENILKSATDENLMNILRTYDLLEVPTNETPFVLILDK